MLRRMNHCVPDFEIEDDYSIPAPALALARPRKSNMDEDDVMELLWQNGQVVMQSQRSARKPSPSDDLIPAVPREAPERSKEQQSQSLFMQEEEMTSWLLNESPYDFCPDLLYSSSESPSVNAAVSTTVTPIATATTRETATTAAVSAIPSAVHAPQGSGQRMSVPATVTKPSVPASRQMEKFGHYSWLNRHRADESRPSPSNRLVNEPTMVDSCATPTERPQFRVSEAAHCQASRGTVRGRAPAAFVTTSGGWETATSSPGGSTESADQPSQKPPPLPPPDDRKRKAKEADDADCQSEDVDPEFGDAKKQQRGSTSTKKYRAPQVHNQSERRRRDRINEKMRALQELIPHSNKADKASMLDEAIEYLKSLQLQVQMMSMGCSMVPMMFPGVLPYMPNMGMGIGMGMDMSRAMMPFPNILASSHLPSAAAHLGPRFLLPGFHTQQQVDQSKAGMVPPSHQPDPILSSLMMRNS